jgi:medium-chain acyl-[acyl-carrier-protein] hydrolase
LFIRLFLFCNDQVLSGFCAVETYVYQDEKPLDCPIHAFGGNLDATTTEDELHAWRLHTNRSFDLKIFQGDHFFIRTNQQSLFKSISGQIPELSESKK